MTVARNGAVKLSPNGDVRAKARRLRLCSRDVAGNAMNGIASWVHERVEDASNLIPSGLVFYAPFPSDQGQKLTFGRLLGLGSLVATGARSVYVRIRVRFPTRERSQCMIFGSTRCCDGHHLLLRFRHHGIRSLASYFAIRVYPSADSIRSMGLAFDRSKEPMQRSAIDPILWSQLLTSSLKSVFWSTGILSVQGQKLRSSGIASRRW